MGFLRALGVNLFPLEKVFADGAEITIESLAAKAKIEAAGGTVA